MSQTLPIIPSHQEFTKILREYIEGGKTLVINIGNDSRPVKMIKGKLQTLDMKGGLIVVDSKDKRLRTIDWGNPTSKDCNCETYIKIPDKIADLTKQDLITLAKHPDGSGYFDILATLASDALEMKTVTVKKRDAKTGKEVLVEEDQFTTLAKSAQYALSQIKPNGFRSVTDYILFIDDIATQTEIIRKKNDAEKIKKYGEYSNLTIDDLLNSQKCKTYDCYDKFITRKGFEFDYINEKSDYTTYTYISKKSFLLTTVEGNTMPYRNFSTFTIYKNSTLISYATGDKNIYYHLLLNELTAKGFTSFETINESFGTTVAVKYNSDKYPNIIITVRTSRLSKDNNSWINYQFSIN